MYVFKSVYGHYVVGPTNVPQDSKEDRGCDVDNVADMKNHIFSYFPGYLQVYILVQATNSKYFFFTHLLINRIVFDNKQIRLILIG